MAQITREGGAGRDAGNTKSGARSPSGAISRKLLALTQSPGGGLKGRFSGLGRDLVGGSISALITLSFSLSFAAMIFAGELAQSLGFGISMALTSASITVTVVALLSPFRFAIAGPDSRSAAVQSALAASLAAALHAAGLSTANVLIGLALSTVVTGAALYACGRMHMGRFIRYVPYPVIGGFLASTGWTLVVGGVRVITSKSVSLFTLGQLVQPAVLPHLCIGIAFTVGMLVVLGRFKHFLVLPAMLVFGNAMVHIVRVAYGATVEQAQQAGWLLKVTGGGKLWFPLRDVHWSELAVTGTRALPGDTIWQYLGGLLVLLSVTAIAVLVTGAAIEVATRSDADLDQELKSHGIANLISGAFGGLVGQNAVARSMMNLAAGGRTRMSGLFAGMLCLIVELTRPELAGYLARPIMGAILAFLGLRLLHEWVIRARTNLERIDYYLVVGMLVMIISFGFIIGLLVGVVVSCLIFAVNYSRISVVKYSFTLDEYGSKVQRSVEEHLLLRERGRQHWVLRLRGYLFFGSVVRLVHDARQRIESSKQAEKPLRSLILDFAAVIGMDSSAAMQLVKLRQAAEQNGLHILLTALQPEMQRMLERERCLRGDEICQALPDLDRALEQCEQSILLSQSAVFARYKSIEEQLGVALGGPDAATKFLSYAERIMLQAGEYLLRQGAPSDEVYVIEAGQVSILLERPNMPPLRLRSVTSNTCLGEIGLYRKSPRTASIIADVPTSIYRISRGALAKMEDEVPKIAMAFHIFIIRTLAERLIASDKTIAALDR
jgi:SulP family sulfate permease